MSFRASCISLSRRALEKVPNGSPLAPARTVLVGRRHNHSSAVESVEGVPKYQEAVPGRSLKTHRTASRSRRDSSDATAHPTRHLTAHVNELFRPLEFPDELARRMLTHVTHKDSRSGHSARLAFMGRRVLETYLLLFLNSVPPSVHTPNLDFDVVTARTLNTYILGEHVAREWNLGRVMRWVPNLPGSSTPRDLNQDREKEQEELKRRLAMVQGQGKAELLKSVGLFKVAGCTVEAIAGGIFHQYGGTVAHKIFHTRVLPHLLLPDSPLGLHDSLHSYAMEICDKMGGLPSSSKSQTASERTSSPFETPFTPNIEASDAEEALVRRKVPLSNTPTFVRDTRKRATA